MKVKLKPKPSKSLKNLHLVGQQIASTDTAPNLVFLVSEKASVLNSNLHSRKKKVEWVWKKSSIKLVSALESNLSILSNSFATLLEKDSKIPQKRKSSHVTTKSDKCVLIDGSPSLLNVMERARKRKNVDTATRTGDDEIHDAEMEVPLINLAHGSRNAASRVDQGIPRAKEATFNVETAATSSQAVDIGVLLQTMTQVIANAPNFEGGPDPDVALYWIAQMETKFKALRFPEDVKTENMTMLQYENKFTSLGRFCPKVFEDEEEKMDRFEQGLREEIGCQLASHKFTTFKNMYDAALVVEMRFKLNEGERSIGKKPRWVMGSNQAVGTRQQGNFQNANKRRGPINANGAKLKQFFVPVFLGLDLDMS
ncbi:hypothetical protein ACH5RR_018034 [Cinchona calisaya]|uniref:Uncharacterized protein n=1 Tax=Cinchona calisaya TaxID=153742 RepID=A0ABD2ZNW8_9GENT